MNYEAWTQVAHVLRSYVDILTWPAVVLIIAVVYRASIRDLLPGARVKLSISGFTFETTIPEIELSISDNLRGGKLNPEQWDWLEKLNDQPFEFHAKPTMQEADILRPLRNSGLIKHYPVEGFLADAKSVGITTLGKLLLKAKNDKD